MPTYYYLKDIIVFDRSASLSRGGGCRAAISHNKIGLYIIILFYKNKNSTLHYTVVAMAQRFDIIFFAVFRFSFFRARAHARVIDAQWGLVYLLYTHTLAYYYVAIWVEEKYNNI